MLQLKGTVYDFINRFDKLKQLSFDIVYADKPLSCELRSYNMKDEYSRRVTISLNFTINCELTIKEQGLGEFVIYSKNEEEAYVIINIFKFLTKRFYRAQLDRELLGE